MRRESGFRVALAKCITRAVSDVPFQGPDVAFQNATDVMIAVAISLRQCSFECDVEG